MIKEEIIDIKNKIKYSISEDCNNIYITILWINEKFKDKEYIINGKIVFSGYAKINQTYSYIKKHGTNIFQLKKIVQDWADNWEGWK